MYQTVFFISLGAWLLFEIWVFLRDRGRISSPGREGFWSLAALAIAIALAMNVPGIAPMFDVRQNFERIFSIGIALVWAGLLFRFWAVRTLGAAFSTRLVVQPGQEMITTGPYRFLRHPSYTGALMTLSGLGVSLGNGISLALLLLTGLAIYALRIKKEEEMLADSLGAQYEAYKKKTWAVIPFVW